LPRKERFNKALNRMPTLTRRWLCITALVCVALVALPAASAASTTDDEAVLHTALQHFAQSGDANFEERGIIIVDPDSTVAEDLPPYAPFEGQSGCRDLEKYGASFAARNSISVPIASVLPSGPHWRVASPDESEAPFFRLDRNAIRTKLFLTLPSYSEDGAGALVTFAFLWSEHVAVAVYVLAQDGAAWAIACHDRQYWP
jgi:hypothetical protein